MNLASAPIYNYYLSQFFTISNLFQSYNRKQERTCIDESVMETGNEVGNLAKNLFDEYVEVPYSREHQEIIAFLRIRVVSLTTVYGICRIQAYLTYRG